MKLLNIVSAGIVVCFLLSVPAISFAAEKATQNIRFYKVNRQIQADRIRLTNKKTSVPGCHNFIKKVRVHRMVQIGYGSCSLYAKKECKVNSLVQAKREKDEDPSTLLEEGYGWFPITEHPRGLKIKSWSCSLEPLPENQQIKNKKKAKKEQEKTPNKINKHLRKTSHKLSFVSVKFYGLVLNSHATAFLLAGSVSV